MHLFSNSNIGLEDCSYDIVKVTKNFFAGRTGQLRLIWSVGKFDACPKESFFTHKSSSYDIVCYTATTYDKAAVKTPSMF